MPWNSSNPLYRWKMKHGGVGKHRKANKSATVHMSPVKHMARRRRIGRRLRRYSPRTRYRSFRRKSRTIPLIPMVGFASTQFTNLGNSSINARGPLGELIFGEHNLSYFARDELLTFTGYDTYNGTFNIMDAKGSMILIGTVILSKLLGKFVGNPLKNLPVVGKYLRL